MAKVSTDSAAIEQLLTRGVENVYPNRDALSTALASGKRLRIYLGVDPTGPTLHLGHVIPMRKLAALQKMGHEVILLIGDFTAMIGDPTDKSATRKQLTRKEVLANCKLYKKQASRILSFSGSNPAKLVSNSKWLAKMSFGDVVELASHFTVQQMLERDMFERRVEEGKPVHLHEFFYPLMQGQDSVAMNVDMELGGNDQTFNMLAGRTLMKEVLHKEKFVLATALLADENGKKMGKTEGNIVAMSDSPEEMYGKVMSWTDGMIMGGFELCTDVSEAEIADMRHQIEAGENPMPLKRRLAREVVKTLIGEKEAVQADAQFTRVHQEHAAPEDMQTVSADGKMIVEIVAGAFGLSKSDARRQVEQNGIKVDGQVVTDVTFVPSAGSVIQKGKRHFVKLT